MEDRRPIRGYEGAYEVDRMGNVYSLDRLIDVDDHGRRYRRFFKGRKLNPACGSGGYVSVRIRDNDGVQKTHRVHRLVAEAFIPNPNGCQFVNHKDEDRTNNCVDNLEWCTNEYNLNYGGARERQRKSLQEYYIQRPKGKRVWAREKGSPKWKEYKSISEAVKATHSAYETIMKSCRGEETRRYDFSFEKQGE